MDYTDQTITSPSGKQYTNHFDIPELTARFAIYMAETGYSGTHEDNKISATTLIGPIKKYLYKVKHHSDPIIKDVKHLINSAKGTNLHNGFESSIQWWNDPTVKSETRYEKVLNGYTISGELDFIHNGMVKDLKHVSNYTLKKLNDEMSNLSTTDDINQMLEIYPIYTKLVLQLSIYRWLCPDELSDNGAIEFELNNGGGFSNLPISHEVILPLIDEDKLEKWVYNRVETIKQHIAEDTLPDCTDQERGASKPEFKLQRYSASTSKYRTVNGSKFDNEYEFREFIMNKGRGGDREEVKPASYTLCSYCDWKDTCLQNN